MKWFWYDKILWYDFDMIWFWHSMIWLFKYHNYCDQHIPRPVVWDSWISPEKGNFQKRLLKAICRFLILRETLGQESERDGSVLTEIIGIIPLLLVLGGGVISFKDNIKNLFCNFDELFDQQWKAITWKHAVFGCNYSGAV